MDTYLLYKVDAIPIGTRYPPQRTLVAIGTQEKLEKYAEGCFKPKFNEGGQFWTSFYEMEPNTNIFVLI
jgi:hypothetical protein